MRHLGFIGCLLFCACGETRAPLPTDAGPDASILDACAGFSQPVATNFTLRFRHDGNDRRADVHLPSDHDFQRPLPFVYGFHGFSNGPARMQKLSDLAAWGDSHGVGIVYLKGSGVPAGWNAGRCCGLSSSANHDDLGYFWQVVSRLENQVCADKHKRAVVGASNGGAMIYRLLAEAPTGISAAAVVAGFDATEAVRADPAVPLLHVHGTRDAIVPIRGNRLLAMKPLARTIDDWAARYRCDSMTEVTECQKYSECDNDASIELCLIDAGHSWPGGSATTERIGAHFLRAWSR